MKKLIFVLLMAVTLNGCCLFSLSDEQLLREIRKDLVESTRPTLVLALDNSQKEDGSALMIEPLKTEKVGTVDGMIQAIDRVYPPADEDGNPSSYTPEALPWGN